MPENQLLPRRPGKRANGSAKSSIEALKATVLGFDRLWPCLPKEVLHGAELQPDAQQARRMRESVSSGRLLSFRSSPTPCASCGGWSGTGRPKPRKLGWMTPPGDGTTAAAPGAFQIFVSRGTVHRKQALTPCMPSNAASKTAARPTIWNAPEPSHRFAEPGFTV